MEGEGAEGDCIAGGGLGDRWLWGIVLLMVMIPQPASIWSFGHWGMASRPEPSLSWFSGQTNDTKIRAQMGLL